MDLQAEKLSLMQAILDLEDVSVIKEIKNILKKRERDWFDDLSEEQQQTLMEAIAEADRGEGIPHEEAIKRLGL